MPVKLVVVGAFAACAGWAGATISQKQAKASGMQEIAAEGAQGLVQVITKPKRSYCSKTKDDCFKTGCCSVVGYNCFTTAPGKAQCMKNCTPSATRSCTQPQGIMDHILQDASPVGTSLYCFAAYTLNTGTTKKNYELDILKFQHAKQIGIFACEQSDVFSDTLVEVGPGLQTTKVTDTEGDWHFAKRKTGAWVNTGMFTSIWRAIASGTKYQNVDWVAKVDADAVFVPNRLRQKLSAQMVPDLGIYFENCKYVDYGYFGNLEVFSQAAFKALLDNMEMCKTKLNWKLGIKNGKYGPMGEDLFAQTCLDEVGIRRAEAFDITTDGACPADRPEDQKKNKKWQPNCRETSTPAMHPFKKLGEWISCWEETTGAFGG